MKNSLFNRRRQFFANPLHREVFGLVFLASVVPMLIAATLLFFLIFQITADQIGFPEAVVLNIVPAARKVTILMLTISPIALVILMLTAYRITHQILGPFGRIVRELDEWIDGKKSTPIKLRPQDKFQPLVDRINVVLERAASAK